MTGWTVTVRVDTDGASVEDAAEAGADLGAVMMHDAGTGRVAFTYGARGGTLRAATDDALRRLRTTMNGIGMAGEPVEVRVLTDEAFVFEVEHPAAADLMGTAEVAQALSISRQRVGELSSTRPDFPRPVVKLAAGPVWSKASVEAFDRRWLRKPGRPRKAG
jgi:hypothetical protein